MRTKMKASVTTTKISDQSFPKGSLEDIVATLAEKLKKKEEEDINVKELREAIAKAVDVYQQFNIYKTKLQRYNIVVERVSKLQNFLKDFEDNHKKLKYPFFTKASEEAVYKTRIAQATELKNYQDSRQLKSDLAYLNSFNNDFLPLVKEGYKAIMNLRKLLTGQEIIYAVQGVNGSRIYQKYLREEEFLELLNLKTQYGITIPIRQFKEKTGENTFGGGPQLIVDLDKIIEKYEKDYTTIGKVYSRDPLYRVISSYTQGESKKKLSTSAAWEVYTEARRIYRDATYESLINDEGFKSFIGDRIAAFSGATKFEYYRDKGTATAALSSLHFYKGGDTSTLSDYVQIQNKSSVGDRGASINVLTVYNCLQYIDEIFSTGGKRIKASDVKRLFTAEGLQGLAKNIATEAFIRANSLAKKNIEDKIRALNNNP